MTNSNRPAALITGGAVRLGKEIALALAHYGYDIAIHYNSSAKPAEETAVEIRALGVECHTFQQNLSDAHGLQPLIQQVKEQFPRFNLLVNSASTYIQAPIMDSTVEMFDLQTAVNVRAPFFLTKAFAQQCQKGVVINIIDNKIAFNQYQYATYLLAKKSLAEFTKMASLELAPALRVNAVCPGVVMPMSSRSQEYIDWRISGIPVGQQGSAENIAQAIRYIIENEFINGQILMIDGGESLTNSGQNAADYDPSKV